jgi:plasmid stabilization system protein ParE
MTRLLESAVEVVRALPADRQDQLARMLLQFAEEDRRIVELDEAEAWRIRERGSHPRHLGEARAVRVRYTPRAATDLEAILDDIASKSPKGARRAQARIQSMIELLARHPRAGRLTNKAALRRIVAYPFPYLIFYRMDGDDIVIHGVRHGARRPDSHPG